MREFITIVEGYTGSSYQYVTNCVNGGEHLHGPGGIAIHEMQDMAQEITYDQFARYVGSEGLRDVFPDYDWSKKPQHLTLKKDYHVRYHKSIWRNIPCVYAVHSGIEYIFTLDGREPGEYTFSGEDDDTSDEE